MRVSETRAWAVHIDGELHRILYHNAEDANRLRFFHEKKGREYRVIEVRIVPVEGGERG